MCSISKTDLHITHKEVENVFDSERGRIFSYSDPDDLISQMQYVTGDNPVMPRKSSYSVKHLQCHDSRATEKSPPEMFHR